MKDRYAILFLAFSMAILFQLSLEFSSFKDNWVLVNPLLMLLLWIAVLTKIQREKGNPFLKHLLKSIKIGVFLLILYFPICILLSFRWRGDLESSLEKLLGKIPEIIASIIPAGSMVFGSLILAVVISYLVGRSENS